MRPRYHLTVTSRSTTGRPAPALTVSGSAVDWDRTGRVAQKRRTRNAIVAAAVALMGRGLLPTVAEAAEAAEVSRATAYRYFPTQEALLLEAGLEQSLPHATDVFGEASPRDPEERIDRVALAFQSALAANEAPARAMLRFALDADATDGGDRDERLQQVRAGRRVVLIEEALAPIRPRFAPLSYRRLVDSLCAVIGIDGFVVARDLRGRSAPEAVEASRWAARALVRAALGEQPEAGR